MRVGDQFGLRERFFHRVHRTARHTAALKQREPVSQRAGSDERMEPLIEGLTICDPRAIRDEARVRRPVRNTRSIAEANPQVVVSDA